MKKRKSRKVTNLDLNHSRKSIRSDNLHVPLTPSIFRKIKPSTSRPSTAKSKLVNSGKSFGEREPGIVRLSRAPPSEVPENVAVHFASFYQNQDQQSLPHSIEEKVSGLKTKTSRNSPKMEFTRQMVHNLEHSAGTLNYGRQVSALLENTVESPGFDLKLPPVDNCSPSNKSGDYYPLWYRDPNKMPQISRKQLLEMTDRYKYDVAAEKVAERIERGDEKSISQSSSETEVEVETETESDEDDYQSNWSSQSSCETETKEEESVSSEPETEDEDDKV